MPSYPNIDKSAFRKGEYVGYGAGRVWRIRKHKSAARCANYGNWSAHSPDCQTQFAFTLSSMSEKLAALPIESGKLLPAVDFPITLIGDPGHAAAQAETVRRLTKRRG